MKIFISLILIFLTLETLAKKQGFEDVVSYNFGMISHGVTENESTLESTDTSVDTTTEEASTSTAEAVSAISFNLNYEFKNYQKKSYFIYSTVPLMPSAGTGVFTGGVGANFYLNDLGTKYTFQQNGTEFTLIPKFKYYWGAKTGVGYVIYNTESAKKTDVFFDLGLHGGMIIGFGEKRGIKFEAGASRATGIATTGIKIGIFLGITQYL